MTNTLKSCPFCGGKARLKSSHGFNNVSCENCGTEYPVSFDTRKKAAAVWNKRSIEDKKDKEIKRLRDTLEKIIGETKDYERRLPGPSFVAIRIYAEKALKGDKE